MGHKSILICTWIKENGIQHTFTVLEIWIPQYLSKIKVLKKFWKVKIIKDPAGFKIMTYRFVDNAQSILHYAVR